MDPDIDQVDTTLYKISSNLKEEREILKDESLKDDSIVLQSIIQAYDRWIQIVQFVIAREGDFDNVVDVVNQYCREVLLEFKEAVEKLGKDDEHAVALRAHVEAMKEIYQFIVDPEKDFNEDDYEIKRR